MSRNRMRCTLCGEPIFVCGCPRCSECGELLEIDCYCEFEERGGPFRNEMGEDERDPFNGGSS